MIEQRITDMSEQDAKTVLLALANALQDHSNRGVVVHDILKDWGLIEEEGEISPKDMDAQTAMENRHIHDAFARAKAEFIDKYDRDHWDALIEPYVKHGIMNLFAHGERLNECSEWFIATVQAFVNDENYEPRWFLNHYECSECGEKWDDEWSCMCNDRCPKCNAEIMPISSEELDKYA